MLSEETALSSNAQAIVGWLTDFLDQSFDLIITDKLETPLKKYPQIWDALETLQDLPVMIMSKSGYAVFDYFSRVPSGSLTLVTENEKIIMTSKLFRNEINIIKAKMNLLI